MNGEKFRVYDCRFFSNLVATLLHEEVVILQRLLILYCIQRIRRLQKRFSIFYMKLFFDTLTRRETTKKQKSNNKCHNKRASHSSGLVFLPENPSKISDRLRSILHGKEGGSDSVKLDDEIVPVTDKLWNSNAIRQLTENFFTHF